MDKLRGGARYHKVVREGARAMVLIGCGSWVVAIACTSFAENRSPLCSYCRLHGVRGVMTVSQG
jgi:hypothetical protein